ncbi:MAG TPA: ATP-binding cassette domain-containing protein [Alphaproteobacteria bacterium]|nr:ATP-binding cassette domain-containing protein [Alphaproteobacteria bacterium]
MKFGPLRALNRLSFEVLEGEVFGIAGPNGAGKSTLLNVCSGFLKPTGGQVFFGGERIDGKAPHQLCRRGLVRTFQVPQVFGSMTVAGNLEIGATFAGRRELGDRFEQVMDTVVELTGIGPQLNRRAGAVDLLTRKTTMLAAVLATSPKLIFMDEPLAGLNLDETQFFVDLIRRLHNEIGITFVVVEHKIRALSALSDRLMVMHFGQCICLDKPENVVRNELVISVYLGEDFVA